MEETSRQFKEFVQRYTSDLANTTQNSVLQSQQVVQNTMQEHNTRIATLEAASVQQQQTNAKFEENFVELRERSKRLEQQLLLANQNAVSREDINSDEFERPPNVEIIRINAHRFVTKGSVEDAITPWLTDSGIESNQWTLEASVPTGKNFIVRFMLNPISAGRLAKDALGNRKDENGQYKVFTAKLVNGNTEKLHIGPDESPKTRTSRVTGKAVRDALAELYPEIQGVHYRLYKASIFAGTVGICRLYPKSPTVTKNDIFWQTCAVNDLGLDKAKLLDNIMRRLARPEDTIEWCL
jgi:hypothetical protein